MAREKSEPIGWAETPAGSRIRSVGPRPDDPDERSTPSRRSPKPPGSPPCFARLTGFRSVDHPGRPNVSTPHPRDFGRSAVWRATEGGIRCRLPPLCGPVLPTLLRTAGAETSVRDPWTLIPVSVSGSRHGRVSSMRASSARLMRANRRASCSGSGDDSGPLPHVGANLSTPLMEPSGRVSVQGGSWMVARCAGVALPFAVDPSRRGTVHDRRRQPATDCCNCGGVTTREA